jgi:hypothetical protein
MAQVEEQGPPQDLRHRAPDGLPEPLGRLEAVLRALGSDLHLDELVVGQRPRRLPGHRLAHPVLPHLHHRGEVVTGGPQPLAQRTGGHERALAGAAWRGHRGTYFFT